MLAITSALAERLPGLGRAELTNLTDLVHEELATRLGAWLIDTLPERRIDELEALIQAGDLATVARLLRAMVPQLPAVVEALRAALIDETVSALHRAP